MGTGGLFIHQIGVILGQRMTFLMVYLLVFWCLPPCRILASCTDLMQAIKELVLSSKHLQRDIVESGRVSNDSDSTTGSHNALLGTKTSFYETENRKLVRILWRRLELNSNKSFKEKKHSLIGDNKSCSEFFKYAITVSSTRGRPP